MLNLKMYRLFFGSFSILALLNCADGFAQEKVPYDIVISGGRVIDPESGLDGIRNIGIIDGRIVVVTNEKLKGKKELDVKGLIVAPGFIDLHSHGQTILADRMQAFDGVTTALELESGILPISSWYADQKKIGRVLNYGTSAAWTYSRIAVMENLVPEPDLIWFQKAFSYSKWVNDAATPDQVTKIVGNLEQGLSEGALGIGINAGYAPGGGYKELMAVNALAAKYKVPTFIHVSGDYANDPNSAAESVGDVISIAVTTGSQAHICHLNSSSLKDIETTSAMILAAQKRGLAITTEAYTYGASSTTIGSALFSEEARQRKSIQSSSIELNGHALDDASFAKTRAEAPGSVIVFHFLDLPKEQDILDRSVLLSGAAIATDGMPWTDKRTGLLADPNMWPASSEVFAHPRGAGTYTRLLAQWVRERKVLPLPEAIRKSSLIPAQILEESVPQMRNKGRIQVGMDADIIVFDLNKVQDKATFTQPYLPSVGMKYVLVNGIPVISAGALVVDARPGKPIRRSSVISAQ